MLTWCEIVCALALAGREDPRHFRNIQGRNQIAVSGDRVVACSEDGVWWLPNDNLPRWKDTASPGAPNFSDATGSQEASRAG